jgi:hypothetical protein
LGVSSGGVAAIFASNDFLCCCYERVLGQGIGSIAQIKGGVVGSQHHKHEAQRLGMARVSITLGIIKGAKDQYSFNRGCGI